MRRLTTTARMVATVIVTALPLLLVPSTAASAADGSASAESPNGKAFATADLTFEKYSAVWKPVRLNDRDCRDNRYAYVIYRIRYQNMTYGKRLGGQGHKKPCGDPQLLVEYSSYGARKIGAAGFQVCSWPAGNQAMSDCSRTVWVDNPKVVG